MKRSLAKETNRQIQTERAAKTLARRLNESGRFDASVDYSALSEAVYLEVAVIGAGNTYTEVFMVRFADHETVNWRRGNSQQPVAELACLPSQVKALGRFLGF